MTTVDQIALLIRANLPVILQRVPRWFTAEQVAAELTALLERTTQVVSDPLGLNPPTVRILDGRQMTEREAQRWEIGRASLGTPDSPLVVLLDAASARVVLRTAPHVTSWAGGVQLQVEHTVRPTQTEQERRLGNNAFSRVRKESRELLETFLGYTIGVDLGTERIFVPTLAASALDAAREELDEGLIHMVRVTDDHLVS